MLGIEEKSENGNEASAELCRDRLIDHDQHLKNDLGARLGVEMLDGRFSIQGRFRSRQPIASVLQVVIKGAQSESVHTQQSLEAVGFCGAEVSLFLPTLEGTLADPQNTSERFLAEMEAARERVQTIKRHALSNLVRSEGCALRLLRGLEVFGEILLECFL